MFYYDGCLPMGCSTSCQTIELFASSLQWILTPVLGVIHMSHIHMSHSRRLFEAKNLTLEKAINLCRISEDTEGEMRKFKLNERINAVYKAKPQGKARPKSKAQGNKSFNKPPTQTRSKAPVHSCGKCGTTHADIGT